MIPALYQKTKEALKIELGPNCGIHHVCLTSDLWTSRANESYMAVIGHFITDEFQLKAILSDCAHFEDAHTNENIQRVLNNIVDEYELSTEINFMVTDNGANIQKAITDIGWKHYGCYGHTLN
ncbi:unnamed protein product [Parnassius mnemosyne]|uniref:Transposase n=1 Tax=Parnassius mnemosyne TaxID=213953 RepID=A0AAV1LTI0_9NEOP